MLRLDHVILNRAGLKFCFNFSIQQGKRLAVMGPSGTGKSTLLDIIAGFEQPDSGKIKLNETDISKQLVSERPLTLLSQNNNLFDHLSVFQNVALGLTLKAKLSKDEVQRIIKSLDDVGLSKHSDKLPTELSGGQQQRAALARSLLRAKPLLLLDEPFSALDQELRFEMAELVNQIVTQGKMTLITVTHDKADADLLSDQIVRLENGVLDF